MIRFINIVGMLKLREKLNSGISSVFGVARNLSFNRLQRNLFWVLILTGYHEKLELSSCTVIFSASHVVVVCKNSTFLLPGKKNQGSLLTASVSGFPNLLSSPLPFRARPVLISKAVYSCPHSSVKSRVRNAVRMVLFLLSMYSATTDLMDECFGVSNDSLCAGVIVDEPGGCCLGRAIGMPLSQFLGILSDLTSKNKKSCMRSTMMTSSFSRMATFGIEG